ncbi:MAG: BatD family protein [Natronospirillum sp.]|uniref:BatD family protein n=1 Tax=Natronospirillum sp. TaxID=2812955 RepID=UPI0025F875E3|nr:BatD family protein [Natronospirillum sp.]MCH8550627.1 BatD family protein [Natronospirillum sp.]
MVRRSKGHCCYGLLMLCTLILLLGASSSVWAATEALASVSRTTLVDGDAFTLRIRVRPADQTPDLAPLRRDFEILEQRQSTNNPALQEELGRSFTEWEITLLPRHSGELTIPALTVGNATTRPIDIRVLQISPEQRAIRDRNVELEVTASTTSPYVDESILVTLTLYYNVNISGQFADVSPQDSEWTALGDAIEGTTRRDDGRNYSYTRFHYLYTPLTPGQRDLPAFSFEGDYRTHSLAPRQTLRDVRSEAIALDVKPIPSDFPAGQTWLPARDVTLEDTWAGNLEAPEVGDQITRQTTLSATGPPASRLSRPQHESDPPAEVRQYEGQVQSDEQLQPQQRVSVRQDEVAYLLTGAGEVTVPALRVPWWDLEEDTLRWAEAPARTVNVAAGALVPAPEPEPEAMAPEEAAKVPEAPTESRALTFAGAVMVLALLLGLGWLLKRRRIRPGALLWQVINRGWLRLAKFWWRPAQDHPRKSRSVPGNGAVRPRKEPGHKQKRADKPSVWLQQARAQAAAQDWQSLLATLSTNLGPWGWPDLARVASRSGQAEFPDLVRATQALLYGAANQQPDPGQLAERWEQCLQNWPGHPQAESDSGGPDGLYPD